MNRLKKYTLIGIVFVIITGTLSHFVYEWTGNSPIAAPFFPVNESTWEHMKLVFFPTLIYGVFMIAALKEDSPCITAAAPSGILAGTAAIPVLFYTYTGVLGFHIFILDIAVFLLSVLIAFAVIFKLASSCRTPVGPGVHLFLYALLLLMLAAFAVFSRQA